MNAMILPVLTGNNPELYRVAHKVPEGQNVSNLITDMWDTMYASKIKAAGLAANQIGILKRVIVVDVTGLKTVIINPEIIKRKLGTVKSLEGCLSFPGKKVEMVRSKLIIVTGFNENWAPIKLKLRGLAGMCVQHEIDHLNGVTIA